MQVELICCLFAGYPRRYLATRYRISACRYRPRLPAALRSVKDDPGGEIVGEIFETMGYAGWYKQRFALLERQENPLFC